MYHPDRSERRRRKVNELILEELGQIIENEMSDPRLGIVTVTRVETSPDLRHSRVFFSALGGQREREEALAALNGAGGFLRTKLAQGLPLQYIPAISFHLDDSLLYSLRVQELLDQIGAGDDEPESPSSGQGPDKGR
jgi:ribosome-binding factor A